ncbi:MAG: chloride channel protein [Leptospirales bacterium]|nr:chloride channel protein [Leptospirales bacterium]
MKLIRLREFLRIKGQRQVFLYSVLIGVFAGLGAAALAYIIALGEALLLEGLAGVTMAHPAGAVHAAVTELAAGARNQWLVVLLPAAGGLAVGLLIRTIGPVVGGAGTDDMIRAFHHNEGKIPPAAPLAKSVGTAITLSTGGSGGSEAPISLIGAGFGSWFAQLLGAGARARRTLLIAGAAGGLGAIFRAPLGGAMVATEVLYSEDIESDSLVPAILSSATAYLTFSAIHGAGSLFQVADLGEFHYRDLLVYGALGLLCYAGGYVYVRLYHGLRALFRKAPLPVWIKPAIGGLGVGLIALFFPETFGEGLGVLQQLILGQSSLGQEASPLDFLRFFALMAAMKMLSSSLTVASGGAAGMFAPSMFIGAMLGGLAACLAHLLIPGWNLHITPFMLVGMGSFFAGVARAPFASMIMVCDAIGTYALLPQLMLVSVIAFMLSHRWSIYTEQLPTRFKSPAHYWDMQQDILDRMVIGLEFPELRRLAIVDRSATLASVEEAAVALQATDFVVRDGEAYYGMLSLKKTRMYGQEMIQLRGLVLAEDITDSACPAVSPRDTLSRALAIVSESEMDKVAVVDQERLMGYVRISEIFARYYGKLSQNPRKSGPPTPAAS